MTALITSITTVWTAVATWFITTMGSVQELFYNSESGLTFLGTLAIFGGGMAVILGVIYMVRGWIKAR